MSRFAVAFVALLAACAPQAPVTTESCAADVTDRYVLHTFVVKNNSDRPIAAVRINFLPLTGVQAGLKFSPERPAVTYDYDSELPAYGSKMFSLHTTAVPRNDRPSRNVPEPCDVISVRYEDGETWAIARGIATP